MDIDSDGASNDVVECSDGKEVTGSDKEIKGHFDSVVIVNNINLKELKLRIILPSTSRVPKTEKNQRILRPAAVTRDL